MDEKKEGYHRVRAACIENSKVLGWGCRLVDVRVNSETVESGRYEIELV